jgi:hypothetical protein
MGRKGKVYEAVVKKDLEKNMDWSDGTRIQAGFDQIEAR